MKQIEHFQLFDSRGDYYNARQHCCEMSSQEWWAELDPVQEQLLHLPNDVIQVGRLQQGTHSRNLQEAW